MIALDNLQGLKEDAIARLGKCPICGEPPLGGAHSGILFYKVTIARAGFDAHALQRRAGLQMMLGNAGALARVMGPNEDLAKILDGPVDVFVHEACAGQVGHLLHLFPEPTESEEAPPCPKD